MNTIIISSSLSPDSKSFILCKSMQELLVEGEDKVTLVDARSMELKLYHQGMTDDMNDLAYKITHADNIIIGMGVHNYSINDSLKVLLDSCFTGANEKFFGVLCAAGGAKSYLATMDLTQICMNQWRMIQLPRVIYAVGSDFKDGDVENQDLKERLVVFKHEFKSIGEKLLA